MKIRAIVVSVALCGCGADDDGVGGDSSPGADGGDANGGEGGNGDGGDAGDAGDAGDDGPPPAGGDCENPGPGWLMCEDFEGGGGDYDTWFANSAFIEANGGDDRGRIRLDDSQTHGGNYAVHMPAAAQSGNQGGTLHWYACDGDLQTPCPLRSYDTLYFRTWVRFAEDHEYVHHFLTIAGSQPDDYWYHGTAGCMPNGELAMSTTVDFREGSHETFFYSYSLDMTCDTNCGNYADVGAICNECAGKGLPTCDQQQQCCWGDNIEPETPVALPRGEWFCLEMMMSANTVGESDGVMEYWVNDQPADRAEGMRWRTSPSLSLNRVQLHHYITTSDAQGHSNQVWFDDVVVSTERIGCQ